MRVCVVKFLDKKRTLIMMYVFFHIQETWRKEVELQAMTLEITFEMNKVNFNIYWLSLSWGLKVLVVKAFLNPYEFIDWEYHSNMLL